MRHREKFRVSVAPVALTLALLLAPSGQAQPHFLRETYDIPPWAPPGLLSSPWLIRAGGDVNGDGWSDVGVRWTGYPDKFRIHSGRDFSIILFEKVAGPFLGGYESVGEGFDFADLNGDGIPDLILGTPAANAPGGSGTGTGRVEVYTLPTGTLLYTIVGQDWDFLGAPIRVVGDTNGNGVPDFLVDAAGADGPTGANVGLVTLREGADGSVIHSWMGQFPGDQSIFASLGDIDQDGHPDFAIARNAANQYGIPGFVRIYSGFSPGQIIREHVAQVSQIGSCAFALFSLGDADGDGVPDYVIGSGYYPFVGGASGLPPGGAWLYSGATGVFLQSYQGPPEARRLGSDGFALEDLDGDGAREILLSGRDVSGGISPYFPGAVYVFSGASGGQIQTIPDPSPSSTPFVFSTFMMIGGLAGVNDGKTSFVVGRYAGGEVHLYDRGWMTVYPNPAPVFGWAIFTAALPTEPGAVFHLYFSSSAFQGLSLGSRTFPLDLSPALLTTAEWSFLTGTLDASGSATIAIPIPYDLTLVGVTLYFAGVTFDAAFPFGVRSISTARSVTLQ